MTQLPEDELATLPLYMTADSGKPDHIDRLHILEFGNKKNATGTYKKYYESRCAPIVYVSIDWNGKDGALQIDVNFPVAPGLHHDGWTKPFDIVTNFGFSEHVTDQKAFWKNHHDLCRPGGIMSGVTPAPEERHWPRHGILQPTLEFYRVLAEANGYTPLRLWQNTERKRYTNCYCYMKAREPGAPYPHPDPNFVWDDDWLKLIRPTQNPTPQALKNSGL